jgi:hypothetical protein
LAGSNRPTGSYPCTGFRQVAVQINRTLMAISRSIWAAHSRTVALRRAPSLDYLAANTTHRSTPMIEANSRVTSVVIILNVLRPKHSRNSSQGQTADRVLIHVDTDKSELLVNNRFAYVSFRQSRNPDELLADSFDSAQFSVR